MTRVTSIDSGQVITTGVVNMRRFEQRPGETRVVAEMLDRKASARHSDLQGTVYDLAIEQERSRDWVISRVALQEGSKRFGRKGQTHVLEWEDIEGFAPEEAQGATHLLAALEEMKAADLAHVIHDLPAKRRGEVAAALADERLADVLEELPEEDQVEILGQLDDERAADVLEEMSPDDAADLIAELPPETAEALLALMEPDEAEDVRRLLSYEDRTAGGMMTTEPIILPPDATVAEALAHVRQAELTPSLAALVYVTRPPLEPPTGRMIGVAHIQRLLREPPSTLVGSVVDEGVAAAQGRRHPRGRRAPPRDVQPRGRRRHRRQQPPAGRRDRRRPARPPAPGELARPRLLREPAADGRARRPIVAGEAPWPSVSRRRRAAASAVRHASTSRGTPGGWCRCARSSRTTRSAASPSASRASWAPRASCSTCRGFVIAWLIYNWLAPADAKFDPFPFIFLTLMLSLQASYAAPLILLAQNRQEDRDRVIAEGDRMANSRAHADMEFLAREMASLRMALGEVATRDYVRSELRTLLSEIADRMAPDEPANALDEPLEPRDQPDPGRRRDRPGGHVG